MKQRPAYIEFFVFYAGKQMDRFSASSNEEAMKIAVEKFGPNKHKSDGTFILMRVDAGASAWATNCVKSLETFIDPSKKSVLFENCTRLEIGRAAKHCGLDESSPSLFAQIQNANCSALVIRKIIAKLQKCGYTRVEYKSPTWMTVA